MEAEFFPANRRHELHNGSRICTCITGHTERMVGGPLRNKTSQEVAAMQHHLVRHARHFQYATPAQPRGPEELTWRMVVRKLPSVRLHIRRSQRSVQGALNVCTCQCVCANSSQNYIWEPLNNMMNLRDLYPNNCLTISKGLLSIGLLNIIQE